MNKIVVYIILSISFTPFVKAQTIDEIMSAVYDKYMHKEPLQFSTTYNLYKSAESKEILESYKGHFYKNASNDVFMKINTTDILNTDDFRLKISHKERAILVTNPEDKVKKDFNMKGLLLIYDVENIKDNKSFWEIKLKSKKLSTEPYRKIVIHISKDFRLKKQVFYYGSQLDFSKNYKKTDLSQPRLEISYYGYSKGEINENIFNSSVYVIATKSGKIKVSEKFKDYELVDRREISNKVNKKN